MFARDSRSYRKPVLDLVGRAHSGGAVVVPAGRLAHVGMARGVDRLDRYLPARTMGLEDAARRWHPRLSLRLRHRHMECRLDHVLGRDVVQHAGDHRRIRQITPLAYSTGNPRRAGADHSVRLGVWRLARRTGRFRLPLGVRGPDPDRDRHSRSRRHPGRGDCEQCTGFLWRLGSPDHRARHRDRRHARHELRRAVADLLGFGRQDRRHPGVAAAVDPALSGVRSQRHVVGVAARDRRLARLHRRPVADGDLSRPLSAGRDRRDRVLRGAAAAAQGVAAGADPGVWRCTIGRRYAGGGARTSQAAKSAWPGCRSGS